MLPNTERKPWSTLCRRLHIEAHLYFEGPRYKGDSPVKSAKKHGRASKATLLLWEELIIFFVHLPLQFVYKIWDLPPPTGPKQGMKPGKSVQHLPAFFLMAKFRLEVKLKT